MKFLKAFFSFILIIFLTLAVFDAITIHVDDYDITSNAVQASNINESSNGINSTQATWTQTRNFPILVANNGFRYDMIHNHYMSDIAEGYDVKIFFDLSQVGDTNLKANFRSVISALGYINNNKIKLYTYTKPSNAYTVTVTDYRYGADPSQCYSNKTKILACANSSKVLLFQRMVSSNYNNNDRKSIIFHELLHVFGFDHTSQYAKGTVLTPSHDSQTQAFNIKNFYNDYSAWNTVNAPFRYTFGYVNGVKYKYKKFLNYYPDEVHKYNSSGNYWVQSTYYLNGKQHKKVYYPGTKVNHKKSEHFYENSGKYWGQSIYYNSSGKKTKKVYYPGTSTNNKSSEHFYEDTGRYWKMSVYYNSNRKTTKRYYTGTLNNQIKSEHFYEDTGRYWQDSNYFKNGIKYKRITHSASANNYKLVEYYYEETGRYWTDAIYYDQNQNVIRTIQYSGTEDNIVIQDSWNELTYNGG